MFFTGNGSLDRIELLGKTISLFLFALALAFLSVAPAEARVGTFYKGDAVLGSIPVMDGEEGLVISIADAGALLGLNAAVAGEELLLSRGPDRVKVVVNAVAAWYNTQLVPLYGASYVRDGRWWLDVPSSLSLLQRFAGRGSGDRLRVEDAGDGVAKGGTVKDGTAKGNSGVGAPTEAKPPTADRVVVVSEPVKTPSPPSPSPPLPPKETAPPATPSPQPAVSQIVGEIRAIRWSTSREKIRMVADCSESTNPEVKVTSGKVSMVFTKAAEDLQGIPSPYDNVKAELVKGAGGS
ncbi:MAG: hypothetical protein LBQ42_02705, partial [Synergistaceae bacterium]|nr:hypothetical protein [Synergistaceae bacterium]